MPSASVYENGTEMLSRLAMRRIASAKSSATDTTSTLSDSFAGWVSTLSVVKRHSMWLSLNRSTGVRQTTWALGHVDSNIDDTLY